MNPTFADWLRRWAASTKTHTVGSKMELKYTRHQVPRGSRPDAETIDKIYLIKNVSILRATYQIGLLVFKALESRKILVIKVPKMCQFEASLKELIKLTGKTIKREDV